jgi:hypothetical protein
MDIAKCNGEDCIVREHCKRFTGKASWMQSYLLPEKEDGVCKSFLPNYKYVNEKDTKCQE